MNCQIGETRTFASLSVYVLAIVHFSCLPLVSNAQTLGSRHRRAKPYKVKPQPNPKETVLNLVNWVGNVISPVGAALAVVMAVVSYSQGRGVARWR